MKHFPGHTAKLETLYRQNESFRSLCEDFCDCVRTKEFWCGSLPVKENGRSLCEEYKSLCADLKKEISRWLVTDDDET